MSTQEASFVNMGTVFITILWQTIPYKADFLAYFFALFIGSIIIMLIRDKLWNKTKRSSNRYESQLAQLSGAVERTLYMLSYQLHYPTFIGLWLSLKFAGRWATWTSEKKKVPQHWLSRFLVGNGLSIGYAIISLEALTLWRKGNNLLAVSLPIMLFLSSVFIYFWITPPKKTKASK